VQQGSRRMMFRCITLDYRAFFLDNLFIENFRGIKKNVRYVALLDVLVDFWVIQNRKPA